jgi:gliding motility-associated lipoprotein GldD
MKKSLLALGLLLTLGCGEGPLPKPKAFLRLDYPTPQYRRSAVQVPFRFDQNTISEISNDVNYNPADGSIGLNIDYPTLKGTVYLTYKPVKDDLLDLLRDAQNLTQKHTIKADEIEGSLFENPEQKVYGMFYEVGGNAASQSQFYATDSLNHFLSGSLYFYAKPNYDSIYPAAVYLKNDIKHIMESLEWKNDETNP